MLSLIMQAGALPADLAQWLKILVIVLALLGVAYIGIEVSGVRVPPWIWRIILICVAAAVCIAGINFLTHLI